jgi:predicted MFS family arabinose efflux permease
MAAQNTLPIDSSAELAGISSFPAAEADATPTSRQAWTLALAATATMSVSFLDRSAFAVLSPTITRALGISDAAYGWLASGFAIAYLTCAPIAGRFIAKVGARRGLLAAVGLWSCVAALHSVVPGLMVLFVLRLLLGMAESPSFPGAADTISRALPQSDRNAGFGVLFTGSSVGMMIAAPLCSIMAARWGWRVALLGTSIVGLSWIPLWWGVTSRPWARRVLDRPAVSGTSGPVPRQFRWSEVLRDKVIVRAMIVIIAAAPGMAFIQAWGPKLLVTVHGITQKQVGSYLWLPPVMFDIGSITIGALATMRDRSLVAQSLAPRPHRVLFALSMVLQAMLACIALTHTPWTTTIVLGIAMIGAGGLYGLATADMMRRLPATWVTAAAGLVAAAQSLAHICANPIIGALRDRSHSYSELAIGLSFWVLPGALLWLGWNPRSRTA